MAWTGSKIGSKILDIFYLLLLMRFLPPAMMGKYTFTVSVYMILSSFINYGPDTIMIRDLAGGRADREECLPGFYGYKIFMSLFIMFMTALVMLILRPGGLLGIWLWSFIGILLIRSITTTVLSAFDAVEDFRVRSVINIAQQAFRLLGLVLVMALSNPRYLFAVWFAAELFAMIGAAAIARWRNFIPSKWFRFDALSAIWKRSSFMIILGLLGSLHAMFAPILILFLAGEKQAGLYGTAFRFVWALVFIPICFADALYPRLTRVITDPKRLKNLIGASMRLLACCGGLLSIIIWFGSADILHIAAPAYMDAGRPMVWLGAALGMTFLTAPLGKILLSLHREKLWVILGFFVTSANILLTIILTLRFGALGAAIAFFASSIAGFLSLAAAVFLVLHLSDGIILGAASALVASACIMFADHLVPLYGTYIPALIALASYGLFFVFMGLFSPMRMRALWDTN